LKAGSEQAYVWLIGEFHQPCYACVSHRDDHPMRPIPHKKFSEVFRGMNISTAIEPEDLIYRIALHEAATAAVWFRTKHRRHRSNLWNPRAASFAWEIGWSIRASRPSIISAHGEVATRRKSVASGSEPFQTR